MRIIALIFCAGLPLAGFTQYIGGYADAANLSDILRTAPSEMHKKTGEAYGTIGTPNVFEEFRNGNIYFANKSVARNLPINYDCFNDRVLYNKGEVNYIMDSRLIDYLEFDAGKDGSVIFKQVFVQERKKTIFMELLYDKESTLYKHYYKSFQAADYTGAYNQDRRYDEYIDNQAWYIELGGGDLQRLKPKKKAILDLLEPFSSEIEKLLKKENLDIKSEDGIIRLVEYYDELNSKMQE